MLLLSSSIAEIFFSKLLCKFKQIIGALLWEQTIAKGQMVIERVLVMFLLLAVILARKRKVII